MSLTHATTAGPGLGRSTTTGAVAGVIASLVMAMYAMFAGLVNDTGFLTPLYHIASLWIAPDTMMASMKDAMGGDAFHLAIGPAVVGAIIHMMTGAMYGAVFGLILGFVRARLGLPVLAIAGLVYGGIVLIVSAFVGLPIAAALFGSGEPISDMAEMAGWGTFTIEHLLFGLALGLLVALDRGRLSSSAAVPR